MLLFDAVTAISFGKAERCIRARLVSVQLRLEFSFASSHLVKPNPEDKSRQARVYWAVPRPAGLFQKKHVEIRRQRLSTKLPHRERHLTSMIGGVVDDALHQVPQPHLVERMLARGKHRTRAVPIHQKQILAPAFTDTPAPRGVLPCTAERLSDCFRIPARNAGYTLERHGPTSLDRDG